MKPRTKKQKRIIGLRDLLPPIIKKQEDWGCKNLLSNYFTLAYKKKHYCLECGYGWNADNSLTLKKKKSTCPSCKSSLKLAGYYKPFVQADNHFAILTTSEEFQVIRVVYVSKTMKKHCKAEVFAKEVMQHWITPKGSIDTVSLNFTSSYNYTWMFHNELEFRNNNSNNQYYKMNLHIDKIFPKMKLIKNIKRNGFKTSSHNIPIVQLLPALLSDSKAETLFKLKEFRLIIFYLNHKVSLKKYWKQVLITIKYGYEIKDITIWCDYIQLLEKFGRDIKSPKYICPIDLIKEHNRYLDKDNVLREKQKREKLKDEIETDQVFYLNDKQKYFEISFVDTENNILIEPFTSVQQVYDEGKLLNHCIFNNAYHKKGDSLLLSARKNNEVIETIEIDLSNFKILQVRGRDNVPSNFNDEVRELVNQNIDHIIKLT